MKSRDIIFSVIFLVLAYHILINHNFLILKKSSDLLYLILVSLGALTMAITSIIDLYSFKEKDIKNKIKALFCFFSSILYILVIAFSIITNKIDIII
jgi:hypothetical protein